MHARRVFNGAVCIAGGLVTMWNGNRLLRLNPVYVPEAPTLALVFFGLGAVMLLAGVVFVQRGLR
jgi:uncharacterized membrane protein